MFKQTVHANAESEIMIATATTTTFIQTIKQHRTNQLEQ